MMDKTANCISLSNRWFAFSVMGERRTQFSEQYLQFQPTASSFLFPCTITGFGNIKIFQMSLYRWTLTILNRCQPTLSTNCLTLFQHKALLCMTVIIKGLRRQTHAFCAWDHYLPEITSIIYILWFVNKHIIFGIIQCYVGNFRCLQCIASLFYS